MRRRCSISRSIIPCAEPPSGCCLPCSRWCRHACGGAGASHVELVVSRLLACSWMRCPIARLLRAKAGVQDSLSGDSLAQLVHQCMLVLREVDRHRNRRAHRGLLERQPSAWVRVESGRSERIYGILMFCVHASMMLGRMRRRPPCFESDLPPCGWSGISRQSVGNGKLPEFLKVNWCFYASVLKVGVGTFYELAKCVKQQ